MDGSDMGDGVPSEQLDAPALDREADGAVVELHHNAGLTAGRTFRLRPGIFRCGPKTLNRGFTVESPASVSFHLAIGPDGDVTLTPGNEPVAVEGVIAEGVVHLEDGDVIQLRGDHFLVRTVRSGPILRSVEPLTPHAVVTPVERAFTPWLWFFLALIVIGLIAGFARSAFFGLCLIGVGGILATLVLRSRHRARQRREHKRFIDNARSLLFQQIVDSRKRAAERIRSGAPTPPVVAHQAAATPRAVGAGLRVSVASGDRSWDPPVVSHRDPGWEHGAVVDELSFLPAVPFVIDLAAAPIALVGDRSSALAVARHLITTALVMSPSDAGVRVDTAMPADWRWLGARTNHTLTVLDGVNGPWEPRTVVLAPDTAWLEARDDTSRFSYVLQIEADRSMTITQSSGLAGAGLIPHGITEERARQLHRAVRPEDDALDLREGQPLLDLSSDHDVFSTPRLLVTGPDRTRNKKLLATAALRQTASHPNRSIYVLDRGDRALIRLTQLHSCERYAAIDQISDVQQMVQDLEDLGPDVHPNGVLLLAPDLWNTIDFYRNGGHQDLADRLDRLVERVEVLPMAASASHDAPVPHAAFLVWVDAAGSSVAVHDLQGGTAEDNAETLDVDHLPGSDLTGSVAHLISPLPEESSQ